MSKRQIDLGTAALIALYGAGRGNRGPRLREGVVIEVVERGAAPATLRTLHDPHRDKAVRYVIQCVSFRQLTLARELDVVAL